MKTTSGIVMGLNSACICVRYPFYVRTAQRKGSLLQGDWIWFLSKLYPVILSEKWTQCLSPFIPREATNGTSCLPA